LFLQLFLAALLTLVAFVLLTAAYVPGNQIKGKRTANTR
jgi:hypothetical protein